MREEFYDIPKGFPSFPQLEAETYNAIISNGGTATNAEIKEYIANKMNLSNEVLEYENSDGITLLIDYRLRWARTSLKNKKLIVNVAKGIWKVV